MKLLPFISSLLFWYPTWLPAQQTNLTARDTISRIYYHQLSSGLFPHYNLDILILTPPGYTGNPAKKYPVLYMLDGQGLFSDTLYPKPASGWKIDSISNQLINDEKIERLIIVAICARPRQRKYDYTPVKRKGSRSGGLLIFEKVLVQEVKPFVDAIYSTWKDKGNTAIGGASFGAIAALLLGLNNSNVFGNIISMSPSLWWDKKFFLAKCSLYNTGQKIWIDVGEKESRWYHDWLINPVRNTKQFTDQLIKHGAIVNKDLFFYIDTIGRHVEKSWKNRYHLVLEKMYPLKH